MVEIASGPVVQAELAPGGVRLRRTAWPSRPQRPWVVVTPRLAGLCSSDLKEARRQREGRSDFGHEVVGTVHSTSLRDLPPGTRVCLDPHAEVDRSTAFGTAMLVSGAPDQLRAALPAAPAAAPDDRAVFVEPLACVAHCARRTGTPARVAIVGAGTAGVLLGVLMRLRGARVTIVNRSPERLARLATKQLVDGMRLVPATDAEPAGHDAVVVTTTAMDGPTFGLAWRLLPPTGGRLVLFGGIAASWRTPDGDMALDAIRRSEATVELEREGKRALVVGAHGPTRDDFATAVRVLDRPLPWTRGHVEELIAARLDLRGLVTLLDAAARGCPDPPGKCVVDLGQRAT